jgi:hypothetical protein
MRFPKQEIVESLPVERIAESPPLPRVEGRWVRIVIIPYPEICSLKSMPIRHD